MAKSRLRKDRFKGKGAKARRAQRRAKARSIRAGLHGLSIDQLRERLFGRIGREDKE